MNHVVLPLKSHHARSTGSASEDCGLLPNVLICGAPKAGTSSLHRWLADHPNAVGSREKETYYFVDPGTHMYRPHANAQMGLQEYQRYFQSAGTAAAIAVLESTPSYMYYETALRLVPDLPTRPKCLFVLREPAQQIYSLFTYFQNNWSWIRPDMSFREYLRHLRRGASSEDFGGNELAAHAIRNARYVDFLVRWRERLGEERMMVRTFDELKADPESMTAEVAQWVGLDTAFYADYQWPTDNETYEVRSSLVQKLNVAIRGKLPKGKLYEKLRAVYRRLNTRKPIGPSDEDRALIAELSQEFKEANDRLRREFDLRLDGWA